MRKAAVLAAVMLVSASLAFAQGGTIGIYADPGGTDCNLLDRTSGLVAYWVVHTLVPCATASQFTAPQPECGMMTYLSDTAQFPVTIGDSQVGVSIGYGMPLAAPIAVLMINFFGQAVTPDCCVYPVLPDPNTPSGQIEIVDCSDNLVFATGGTGVINPNPGCDCNVPTADSTWGAVKALYSE